MELVVKFFDYWIAEPRLFWPVGVITLIEVVKIIPVIKRAPGWVWYLVSLVLGGIGALLFVRCGCEKELTIAIIQMAGSSTVVYGAWKYLFKEGGIKKVLQIIKDFKSSGLGEQPPPPMSGGR